METNLQKSISDYLRIYYNPYYFNNLFKNNLFNGDLLCKEGYDAPLGIYSFPQCIPNIFYMLQPQTNISKVGRKTKVPHI